MAIVIETGAFFLGLALVVNVVAFLVPYWTEEEGTYSVPQKDIGKGLWGDCECRWHFNNFKHYSNNEPGKLA